MFNEVLRRYLHGPEVAGRYRSAVGIATHRIAPDIVATVHDSDPFWLVVFRVNGEPVAAESCVSNHEEWAMKAATDTALLEHVRSLV